MKAPAGLGKKQHFTDEIASGYDSPTNHSNDSRVMKPAPSDIFAIKIKKSDNTIVKITINVVADTVKDLKDRVFSKERDEGKNIRLIYQGKILQDQEVL